jgi:hypothetical protein
MSHPNIRFGVLHPAPYNASHCKVAGYGAIDGHSKICKKMKKILYICGENDDDVHRCLPEAQSKKR